MAAKLQCEVCGGKLVGKPGGIFECEYCGVEYSTAWAKEKIQQITGTVQIEGTVEVQGKVQVEGAVNKESLLSRGKMALEDGTWDKAKEYFDAVLNADAKCAAAYLGLAMAKHQLRSVDQIGEWVEIAKIDSLEADLDFNKYLRFENGEQKAEIQALLRQASARCAALEPKYLKGRKRNAAVAGLISARERTIGVKSDGTIVATWYYTNEEILNWKNIVAISTGESITAGLRSDGTVVTTWSFIKDVLNWKNIVAISAGKNHVVGLRSDGTVVAAGKNDRGQCNVGDWKGIVAISAGFDTVGLRSDGTMVTTGHRNNNWKHIVAISVRGFDILALRSDGTVASTTSCWGFIPIEKWKDIIAISMGKEFAVGLRSDGTVVAAGKNDRGQCDVGDWKDIIAISAGDTHTIGLKSDGTVVATKHTGGSYNYQCDVDGWKLFNRLETLDLERKEGFARVERIERERQALTAALASAQHKKEAAEKELADLYGVFSGIRRRELVEIIARQDREIVQLQQKLDALKK